MVPQLSWQSKGLKILVSPVRFLVAPQQRKAKQRKILIFNENRDFLFSLNIVPNKNLSIKCFFTYIPTLPTSALIINNLSMQAIYRKHVGNPFLPTFSSLQGDFKQYSRLISAVLGVFKPCFWQEYTQIHLFYPCSFAFVTQKNTSIGIFNAIKSGIFKDTSGNILPKNRSLVVKKSMDKG